MICKKCIHYDGCEEERKDEKETSRKPCKYYIYDVIKYDRNIQNRTHRVS